jgi:RimJ/RimL family protein N-acetyltransferase
VLEAGPQLQTQRLLLRRWLPRDRDPFAAICADPIVMEHFPATLSRDESRVYIERIEAGFEADGYGFWAVEVKGVGERPMIGFVGLRSVDGEMPFAPAVELGWLLDKEHWGQGYATEAATAAISFGFEELGLAELIAYTAERNRRSRRVMERLGMHRDPAEDFSHPKLATEDPLAPHVLYRLPRPAGAGAESGLTPG